MDQRDVDLERLPPVEAYIHQRNAFYELPWSKRVYPQWSCSEPPQLSDWHPIRPPRLDFQFRAFVFDREDNIEYFIGYYKFDEGARMREHCVDFIHFMIENGRAPRSGRICYNFDLLTAVNKNE